MCSLLLRQAKTAYATRRRHAFTLVELLVVIAVLAVLLALLLPAVQAARESGRRANCQSNLKQIGLALLTYHEAHRTFPHGGWGHEWVGVPERGAGRHQPGGWVFSVLPFVESRDLYNLGAHESGAAAVKSYSQRMQTPVSLFVCPTRRPCTTWPVSDQFAYARTPRPFGEVTVVARGDYAINGGSSHVFSLRGPADLQQGDDEGYWKSGPSTRHFSGISHLRRAVSMRSIVDGTSKTYLAGEKFLEPGHYATGESIGDNESLYAGYGTDLHRFAGAAERIGTSIPAYARPLNDNEVPDDGIPPYARFGSAHAGGVGFVTCDGAVRFVAYDVEPVTHFRSGHRFDHGNELGTLFGSK